MPMIQRWRRSCLEFREVSSTQSTVTLPPASGYSKRLMQRTNVDLPAPKKPMIPKISPALISIDKSSTALMISFFSCISLADMFKMNHYSYP